LRALRGLLIAYLMPDKDPLATYEFHRERMITNGWWDVYGETIRQFAVRLI
jgi:hypothetical protein